MIRLITSFLSEKDILNTSKSNTPVIFLGGMCSDNSWREEIKKEFGKDFYFLDPFDKNYDKDENVYKELAGIVNSDYVLFYKGGDQSEQEKKFIDLISDKDNIVKEFDDIKKLKDFLKKLRGKSLESISSKIKKCASDLMKEAVPFIQTSKSLNKALDLKFEKLDNESIYKVVQDILKGETIKIPKYDGDTQSYVTFNINDVSDPDHSLAFLRNYNDLQRINRAFQNRHTDSIIYYYDSSTNTYHDLRTEPAFAKEANSDATYSYSCTMVDFPDDIAKDVIDWGKSNIPDKDLYTNNDSSKGRENQIHVTVFYGIKDKDPTKTAKIISKTEPFEIRLGLINLFKDKKEYDVLKIEIEAGALERLHYSIEENIKNKNDFPTYKPHATIAYVKKGTADKFVGDESFKGITFKVNKIVFSDGDSYTEELPLRK